MTPPSGSLSNIALTGPNNAGYTLPDDAVWLITGCSSGLGLSLAQLIAAHPAHRVVATARNPAKIKGLLPSSSRVLVVALDVTSPSSITSALGTVLEHPDFGRVDVLVNNAGHGLMGDTESSLPYSPAVPNSSDEEHSKARAVVDTDFWGTATMTLHAMRIMREDNARNGGKQGGLVIQISSMGGFMAFPGNAYYHAAKFGVEGFTESVRREVRPHWNIHFTIAEPGGIDTNYATSSMSTLAKHPAYDAADSPARILAAYVDNPEARKSWSRPEAMSKAIYEMASRGKPVPLRFPLGAVAWQVLRSKAESTVEEFAETRALSIGVDGTEHAKDAEKVKDLY
ncbi:hypothetical protein INS49_001177 [Diaporthe citri]|uniref:uncharacterized protein n=1 Tax=Diaporthe citri TaxID=83186 RepID=UPI001C7E7088|nr:uncharacterized protein INS49_001177 [Diaporthe citri]KAG6366996.1 hypothetical protein INS49_001177 [Diaporthe citri]